MSSAAAAAVVIDPDEARGVGRELRSLRTRNGMSQKHVAKHIDVSDSVVSQVESGTYQGDLGAMIPRVRAFIARELQREVARGVAFCRTDTARRIAQIAAIVQGDGVLGAVVGRAGTGKTAALLQYAADNPGGCLYVLATLANASPKALLGQLCEANRLPTGGTLPEQQRRLVHQLSGTNRLLLFDDAHNISTRGLLALQGLHDLAVVPMLLVGNPVVIERIFGARAEPLFIHLASRFIYRRVLDAEIPRIDVQMIARAALGDITAEIVDALHRVAQGLHGLRGVLALCRIATRLSEGHAVTAATIHAAERFAAGLAE